MMDREFLWLAPTVLFDRPSVDVKGCSWALPCRQRFQKGEAVPRSAGTSLLETRQLKTTLLHIATKG